MAFLESGQDYLEAILMLQKTQQVVKSSHIARHLNVTKQSVHRAIQNLKIEGYLVESESLSLELTELGLKTAKAILERHLTLTRYLILLGVDEKVAEKDACKIEHDLSEESYQAIKNWAESNTK